VARLSFRPVTEQTWADFEALFESPSAPKYCWCMAWRPMGHERRTADGAVRKAEMQQTVAAGTPVGLLGYLDGEPVAWVSIAPKPTYRRLGGPKPAPGEEVWSLACMFVKRAHRGQGLADELIAAAVSHARNAGATVVEAYPVDPGAPSYRFMGFVPAFSRAGFSEVARAGTRRHVMRLL
jgi:GNAT superfamily N-acetyltransferase